MLKFKQTLGYISFISRRCITTGEITHASF